MKVALFGATGFVGSYIIDYLIAEQFEPSILIRKGSEKKILQSDKCRIISGDINDVNAIDETIEGCETVIYNIGIIREFPKKEITFETLQFQGAKRCIDATIKSKIKRFILMSANGVEQLKTNYQKTKLLSEEYLKTTNLDYTIFRPSLIFGDPRGAKRPEFCTQLKKDMLNLPLPAPNFYLGLNPLKAGNFAMSPIHVKDVAAIFVKSIGDERTLNKTYHLGAKTYYWKEIIKIISGSYGKNKWIIPAPVFAIKGLSILFGRFSWFPVTKDQITMLVEGNVCNSEKIFKMFNISPIPFNSESLSYLKK